MKDNAFLPADILLPKAADMTKWSVIACDQFSSERAYWERVKAFVGDAPSTLQLIVPEAYLEETNTAESAAQIAGTMCAYLDGGIFTTLRDSYIYIERTLGSGDVRRGLVGKIDLEKYDFTPGAKAAVRASERTILERLPARIDVRRQAPLELPHIMALIDDKDCTVIEPLSGRKQTLRQVYGFDLMEDGGAIAGWCVTGEDARRVSEALGALFEKSDVQMIIGDGNHSLAAAKGYWDEIKGALSDAERRVHPARFALVEVNNVYDPAITFEAIHRVVFETQPDALLAELTEALSGGEGEAYEIRWVTASGGGGIAVRAGSIGALIARLQTFLDAYVAKNGCIIDYIHGEDSVAELTKKAGSIGFMLPAMDKSDFFKTVIAGGVFPKKSFSIGHARDKRYYLECRAIIRA